MLKHRIIPCLLLRDGGLVKTQQFSKPKYIGDPINAIHIFNDKEVDELIVLDIDASKTQSGPGYELIQQFASECFMPLTYGGGITELDQARKLFALGVEKVCLQSSVLENFKLLKEISVEFGVQSVVVSIDIKKNWWGKPKLYSASARKSLGVPWTDFLEQAVDAGAGEIVLNAVDKDGLRGGMDWELIEEASSRVSVPIIALGGVGSLDDMKRATECGASAVSAGAFFVFHGPHRAVLITYPKYEVLEQLLSSNNEY